MRILAVDPFGVFSGLGLQKRDVGDWIVDCEDGVFFLRALTSQVLWRFVERGLGFLPVPIQPVLPFDGC